MRVSSCLASAPLLALLGCQPAVYAPPAFPYCEEVTTELASVDEVGPGGVAAADFLARVEGVRTSSLEYLPPPEDDRVYVEIERSVDATPLDIELSPDTSTLRWVESEIIYPEGSEGQPEPYCDSRLELEASVVVGTEDGVFAEQFDTTIAAVVDDDGALDFLAVPVSFDPMALLGSFEVLSVVPDTPPPEVVYHELWIEYPLGEGDPAQVVEPRGYVGGVAEYNLIDYYLLGVFTIATFGGYELEDPAPVSLSR